MNTTTKGLISQADTLCKSPILPAFMYSSDATISHLDKLAEAMLAISQDASLEGSIIQQNAQDFYDRLVEMSDALRNAHSEMERMAIPDMADDIARLDA